MNVRWKVCGVTRPEDALQALAVGANFIGVNRWPQTPRCASEAAMQAVLEVVPIGKRVYVDVLPEPAKLRKHAELFDFFQIHFPHEADLAPLAEWEAIVGRERLWLAPKCPPDTALSPSLLALADTFLVDAYRPDAFGGTGKTANWPAFRSLQDQHPDKVWILAGGLSPENVCAALEASGTRFIDVNSGVETAPGIKDANRLSGLAALLD